MRPALADWSSKWLTVSKFKARTALLPMRLLPTPAHRVVVADPVAVAVVVAQAAVTTVAVAVVMARTVVVGTIVAVVVPVATMAAKSSSKSWSTSTASPRR